jgi:hypothetical protein
MKRRLLVGTVLLAVVAAMPATAQEEERWRGAIDLASAGAGEMEFFVTFAADGDTAKLSIPAQGARDVPVQDVVYTAARIEFTLAAAGAVFAADRDGDTANGTLEQGGTYPISLERLAGDAPTGPNRPQTPQAPFPYAAHEVTYTNAAEGNTLAGTLTVPAGAGPHPAAILITGSGVQDRDETLFEHKPFWVVADHLSRNGIAVLRVDDRGIGGSDGARPGLTSVDFAGDVAAGVEFLRGQDEIDASRVGLIGHSEGGFIAPMVAADDPAIAFIIMLAGTGVDGAALLRVQNEMILRAAGADDAYIETQVGLQESLWAAMISDAEESVIEERLGALLDHQLQSVPPEQREAARADAMAATRAQTSSAWLRYFLRTDPAIYLERVKTPVLALNGTLDLQVSADQNLPPIEAALRRGGNTDVTVQRFENLNHLFQHASTGLVAEYGTIEETFAPEVLEMMTTWLRERLEGS